LLIKIQLYNKKHIQLILQISQYS